MFKLIYESLITLGSITCHQLDSRSFFIDGLKLPFCTRDTGIYFAFLFCFFILLVFKKHHKDAPPTVKSAILLSVLMLPMMLDGITSYIGMRQTNNLIRFVTGLIFGCCLAYLIMTVITFRISGGNKNRIIKSNLEIFGIILVIICFAFFVYYKIQIYLIAAILPVLGQHILIFIVFYSIIKRIISHSKVFRVLVSTSLYLFFICFVYYISFLIKSIAL